LKYRIAEGARMKIPYMCVVGRREAESDQVAVNTRGAGEGQKPAPVAVDEFIARVRREVADRALTLSAGK
jgi:threonyl-tRNA synthetase